MLVLLQPLRVRDIRCLVLRVNRATDTPVEMNSKAERPSLRPRSQLRLSAPLYDLPTSSESTPKASFEVILMALPNVEVCEIWASLPCSGSISDAYKGRQYHSIIDCVILFAFGLSAYLSTA